MKAKWLFVVLVLIVLPVAFLSFLAARTIRNQEIILAADFRRGAQQAIASVDGALHDTLLNHLEAASMTLSAALRPGRDASLLSAAAARVVDEHPLVQQVFVFVNPWGFLYGDSTPGHAGDWRFYESPLADKLRGKIAEAGGLFKPIAFRDGMAVYMFRAVSGQPNIWVGYRVAHREANRLVIEALSAQSGGLRLSLVHSWDRALAAGRREAADVLVSDSLSADAAPAVMEAGCLAVAPLSPPLDFLVVEAFPAEPRTVSELGIFRARFLAVGTILAGLSVVVGIVVALYKGYAEIREARHRGEFLLGVSHDLRTPLASMRMLAESLAEGRVRETERGRFLGTIVSECDRLAQLIERVLYLFRYGQGALVYTRGRLDVGAVVRGAVADMRAPAHNLQLRVAPDLPEVNGDEAALRQVILNLLDNAAKYGSRDDTKPAADAGNGSATIEVSVDSVTRRLRLTGPRRDWVRITVRDYGIGIARRERRRVFGKFYRSPRARDRNVSGVGLGLALCRHVVHNHGGRIELRSKEGEGSAFSVYLPAAT